MIQIQKNIRPSGRQLPKSSDLGFGQYFTDHVFCARFSENKGWHSFEILPYQNFHLDPAASVFHYGQALFEGLKAFKQDDGTLALFRPEFNAKRMQDGAERLCLPTIPTEVFMSGIKSLIEVDKSWVPSDANSSLYIRPTLIGTEAFLGVRPSKEALFFVILSPVGAYYGDQKNSVKIWVETDYLRAAPGGLGAVKAGANYAASLKAALNARSKGYAQVMWLGTDKQGIEEVGTMNVFFVFKNEICTPELNGSILAGGTREATIEILKKWNLPICERHITISEVIQKHQSGELLEIFGTGTAAVISPVGVLHYKNKDYSIHNESPGPLSQKLLKEITDIQYGRTHDHMGWMQKL